MTDIDKSNNAHSFGWLPYVNNTLWSIALHVHYILMDFPICTIRFDELPYLFTTFWWIVFLCTIRVVDCLTYNIRYGCFTCTINSGRLPYIYNTLWLLYMYNTFWSIALLIQNVMIALHVQYVMVNCLIYTIRYDWFTCTIRSGRLPIYTIRYGRLP